MQPGVVATWGGQAGKCIVYVRCGHVVLVISATYIVIHAITGFVGGGWGLDTSL